jgi:hypothetical protein
VRKLYQLANKRWSGFILVSRHNGVWSLVLSVSTEVPSDVVSFTILMTHSVSLPSSQSLIKAPDQKALLQVSASPFLAGQTFSKFDNEEKCSGPTSFGGVLLHCFPSLRLSGLFRIAPATFSLKGNTSKSKFALPSSSSWTHLQHCVLCA